MHDAFFKSVFAERRMVEILIHGHAPPSRRLPPALNSGHREWSALVLGQNRRDG